MRRLLLLLALLATQASAQLAGVDATVQPVGTASPTAVAAGGTGGTTATAYGPVLTGTSATGAFKLNLGPGTAAQVLTSNGAGAYPTWQAAAGVSGGTASRFALFTGASTLTTDAAFAFDVGANTNPLMTVTGKTAGSVSLVVTQVSAATAAAQEWRSSSGAVIGTVYGGGIYGGPDTAFTGESSRGAIWTYHNGGGYIMASKSVGVPLLSTQKQYVGNSSYGTAVWTTLTDATPTNLATMSYGASLAVGAEFRVLVEAADGTDRQGIWYRVVLNSLRKATGDTVSQVAGTADASAAASTGTLTCTWGKTEGASAVVVTASCDTSLTAATLRATLHVIYAGGAGGSSVAVAQN